MSCLHYAGNELYIEEVSLKQVAATYGTPVYVYSRAMMENNWRAFDAAFSSLPHRICYAVKANSNIAILNVFARLQSGFDIVSLGELKRVIAAGGYPANVVFSGVGKRQDEIEQAIDAGVSCFNVESEAELARLQTIAAAKKTTVNIALRVNPDVDARTHFYISTGLNENKFGIESSEILALCKQLPTYPALKLTGLACHIGSQITALEPFMQALDCLLALYEQVKALGLTLEHLDIGGGLGIIYRDEQPPAIQAYAEAVKEKLRGYPVTVMIEPGRAIVGNAGALLTRVDYLKHNRQKNFALVDAGMNDLLRPALYHAWQDIIPVEIRHGEKKLYDIAGPVCESADFLGKDRRLAIQAGDLLAVDSAGAYGFSMCSTYNSRCRPAEILIDKAESFLIRRRETINELFAAEMISSLSDE